MGKNAVPLEAKIVNRWLSDRAACSQKTTQADKVQAKTPQKSPPKVDKHSKISKNPGTSVKSPPEVDKQTKNPGTSVFAGSQPLSLRSRFRGSEKSSASAVGVLKRTWREPKPKNRSKDGAKPSSRPPRV